MITVQASADDELIYPYRLKPVIKEKIWGGRNLESVLGKALPPDRLIGETWEAWEGCLIENGAYAGQTLDWAIDKNAAGVLGSASAGRRFPLLFKFIDAQDDLSVQVHPDDAQAQAMEDYAFGKTEAWYILDAAPDSRLILGLSRNVKPEEIAARIRDNTLVDLMAFVPVRSGDVLFVPAGTVHAIGKGIVLAEIQENSDITYRLYDWGREAKGRELHVDASLRVMDFTALTEPQVPSLVIHHPHFDQRFLVACRYFVLEHLEIKSPTPPLLLEDRFQIFSVIQGAANISYGEGNRRSVEAARGQTFVIPAQLGEYEITPQTNSCGILRAFVPDLQKDVIIPLRRAGYDNASIGRLGGPVLEHNDLLPPLRN